MGRLAPLEWISDKSRAPPLILREPETIDCLPEVYNFY